MCLIQIKLNAYLSIYCILRGQEFLSIDQTIKFMQKVAAATKIARRGVDCIIP